MAALLSSPASLKSLCKSSNPSLTLKPSHNTFVSLRFTSPGKTLALDSRLRFKCHSIYNGGGGDFDHARLVYPRPAEIPWKKELCNSVQLIGVIGTPIQIKHLSSGKVLAWTRLAVKKSPTDTIWINLTLWDELAHVAFQHVEKGNQVYVSGRLLSDTVEGDDEKRRTYYKVVVQQLNFIENVSPVPLYESNESNTNSSAAVITGGKNGNAGGNQSGSTEKLWQAFFANPVDWWDNRKNKRNLKSPDFKHKHTGEALWIEGKYNPPWVKSQLAILDSRMESLHSSESNMRVAFMSGDDFAPF